ncbi:MAG TPA: DUF4097 family beta strand repeat-containing protein [Bryobacteraceae bacterium]|nr:DUF4097 family beta strand repeat-containing protein [Bryobacteraceae bacterium]
MKRIALMLVFALSAMGQQLNNMEKSLTCEDGSRRWSSDNRERFCEMREYPLAAVQRLSVDAKQNGGVSVKGWNRSDVLVRAKVDTWAETSADARLLAGYVQVRTAGGNVYAEQTQEIGKSGSAVTYEIFVPHRTGLSLKAHNGGLNITDVIGQVEFEAQNGGVNLARLGGMVKGKTTNGGLNVELAGSRWEGGELNVSTTNGGVNLLMPDNYSARLETSTRNGRVKIDYPVTLTGDITRDIAVNIGSGGPLVKVTTVNGGVNVRRKS